MDITSNVLPTINVMVQYRGITGPANMALLDFKENWTKARGIFNASYKYKPPSNFNYAATHDSSTFKNRCLLAF